jgi:hypothetical protein
VPPGGNVGNVVNWRIGAGGRMYYPIQVDNRSFPTWSGLAA